MQFRFASQRDVMALDSCSRAVLAGGPSRLLRGLLGRDEGRGEDMDRRVVQRPPMAVVDHRRGDVAVPGQRRGMTEAPATLQEGRDGAVAKQVGVNRAVNARSPTEDDDPLVECLDGHGLVELHPSGPVDADHHRSRLDACRPHPRPKRVVGLGSQRHRGVLVPLATNVEGEVTPLLAVFPDGPFFFGGQPMFCDFTIFHHFQIAQLLVPRIFAEHPQVEAFMTAMAELPGVKNYLESRPQLTGVGTAPVLTQGETTIQPGFA